MFQLTDDEFQNLKSQIVISSWGGSRRSTPYAFTQEGVAMLSSVLRSPLAVKVNIEIMRAFVRMRYGLSFRRETLKKIMELERRLHGHDADINSLFVLVKELMESPDGERRRIGFTAGPELK